MSIRVFEATSYVSNVSYLSGMAAVVSWWAPSGDAQPSSGAQSSSGTAKSQTDRPLHSIRGVRSGHNAPLCVRDGVRRYRVGNLQHHHDHSRGWFTARAAARAVVSGTEWTGAFETHPQITDTGRGFDARVRRATTDHGYTGERRDEDDTGCPKTHSRGLRCLHARGRGAVQPAAAIPGMDRNPPPHLP